MSTAQFFLASSRRVLLATCAAVVLVYVLAFLPLHGIAGSGATFLAVPLVALAALLWGLRGGLLAGLCSVVLNTILMFGMEFPGWAALVHSGFLTSGVATVLLGAVVGRATELSARLRGELAGRERAEVAARESEQRYRSVVDHMQEVIFQTDAAGRWTFLSRAWSELTGLGLEESLGRSILEFIHPDDGERGRTELLPSAARGQRAGRQQVRLRAADGAFRWVEIFSQTTFSPDGAVLGTSGTVTDISERRQAEEVVRLLGSAVQQATDSVLITGPDLTAPGPEIVFVNPAFTRLTGYTEDDVIGKSPRVLQGVHTERLVLRDMRETLARGEVFRGELTNYRKDGAKYSVEMEIAPIRDREGEIRHYVALQRDVTLRKALEKRLVHDASHDALTGLPNRALFMDRLERAIARVRGHGTNKFAVLFLDLDRFKLINDGLGHLAGDEVLRFAAQALERCIHPSDMVARFGGDEFAILLNEVPNVSTVLRVADRIHEELAAPIRLGTRDAFTSASIGIALSGTGYTRAEDVIRDADTAMYQAKALGPGNHAVFDTAMHAHAVALFELETSLRRAIEQDELRVLYQPIVALDTGYITGVEALVRWVHPERGMVSPASFVPIAEETGLVVAIDRWVARQACEQLREWQQAGVLPAGFKVAVNLSGRHLWQPDVADQFDALLAELHEEAKSLKLEITESAMMKDASEAAALLARWRRHGVHIAIDDFGTGYSSLAYLQHFPADTLKVDRSFTSRIGPEGENMEIVRAIVSLAHNLGMNVVVEGVETEPQRLQLGALGCEFAQGYLWGAPTAPEKIAAMCAAIPQSRAPEPASRGTLTQTVPVAVAAATAA